MSPLKASNSEQRMAWDVNPRTTFAVAGFQGRRRGLHDFRCEHRRKHSADACKAVRDGTTYAWARHPESSQTESPQVKSRPLTRQVSDKSRPACLELARNGEEWDRPTQPCSVDGGPTTVAAEV